MSRPLFIFLLLSLGVFQACEQRQPIEFSPPAHGHPPIVYSNSTLKKLSGEVTQDQQPAEFSISRAIQLHGELPSGVERFDIETMKRYKSKQNISKTDYFNFNTGKYQFEYISGKKTHNQINIIFDNDIFANRDYYFTNGARLEIILPFLSKNPLQKLLPQTKNSNLVLHGMSIEQDIFTPTNPDTPEVLVGDHPFSGTLMIGFFKEAYDFYNKLRIRSEFSLGVIGPASFGGEVQSSIHEIEPLGWTNQINNDLILDYSLLVEKKIFSNPHLEFTIAGFGSIGTLKNMLGASLSFRIGSFIPVYTGPATHLGLYSSLNRSQYWFFFNLSGQSIFYDATLQGGLFNRTSPYVLENRQLKALVGEASMGIAFYHQNMGVEYEQFFQSPRFNGAMNFGWGRIKLVAAF